MPLYECKKCNFSTTLKNNYTRHLGTTKHTGIKKVKVVDYTNGKIYRLYSEEKNLEYIGSTTMPLKLRLQHHQSKTRKGFKVASRDICLEEDCVIELLEEYPCKSKKELEKREQYWMDKHPNCCNYNRAHGLDKEKVKISKKKYWEAIPIEVKREATARWAMERRKKKKECPHCHKEYGYEYLPKHIELCKKGLYSGTRKYENGVKEHRKERIKCPKCDQVMTRGSYGEHVRKNRCGTKNTKHLIHCKFCKKMCSPKTLQYLSDRHYKTKKCLEAQKQII